MKNIWKEHSDKMLVLIALVMGLSYPVAKGAMSGEWGHFKFAFLSLRFILAFAVLFPLARAALRADFRKYLVASVVVGMSLVATYGFQYAAFAVKTATAGSVAFIMASKVVVVTALTAVAWKSRWLSLKENPITPLTIGAAGLATIGLQVFTYQPGFRLLQGEWLAATAMVGYAVFLIVFSEYGRRGLKPIPIVAGASFVIAIITALLSLVLEVRSGLPSFSWNVGLAIAWMGLIPGAFGLLALFRVTADETRRALILSLEPVFAALCGGLFLGERLGVREGCGALLILLGVVLKPAVMTARNHARANGKTGPLVADKQRGA